MGLSIRALAAALLIAAARRRDKRHAVTIAAKFERPIQLLFLKGCEAAAQAIDAADVVAARYPGELRAALHPGVFAFDTTVREPLVVLLAAAYLKTRQWAAADLGFIEPGKATDWLAAAAETPQQAAVRWATARAAELVGYVTEDMHAAIERLMAVAFQQGFPPADLHQLILENFWVGLTLAQLESVLAVWRSGASTSEVRAWANRQRANRALLIGRTESITATSAGQQAFWTRAAQTGGISRTSRRRWVALATACPRCKSMHGQERGLTEAFLGPDGPVMTPPAHPSCRCAVVLITNQ